MSDAYWKESFGPPTPIGRDVWSYRGGRFRTRSWARNDAPRGRDWNGYFEENYFVKQIEVVWAPKDRVSAARARVEIKKLMPTDSELISKSRRSGSMSHEYYLSQFLAERLSPGMAGDDYCVTPWGYGLGKIKVEYHFVRGRVSRALVDVGEPHQTSRDLCKGV
ncbi:MAG: hypothetical protein ABR568_19980 [Pyrinomonadaceae bacterium]